jgi:putative GTP pyrophosphokinase
MVDWHRLLLPYEQAVAELEIKFRNFDLGFRKMGDYSPIESVNGRVKNIISIVEKARIKDIPLSEVEQHIEDIAGVRIVTKFVEDIAKIVLMIRARSGGDLEIVREKDYLKKPKESGYKSYHVIVKYAVYTSNGPKEILAEIQIRTLAMNFWATIEHSLKYKYRHNMPANLKNRLIKCAEASYNLDEEMAKIRSEIIEAERIEELKTSLVNEIVEKLQSLSTQTEESDNLNCQFYELCDEDSLEKLYAFNKHLTVLVDLYRVHQNIV